MTFLSALVLGLVASAHCAAMCGGLQMALQGTSIELRSAKQVLIHLVLMNLGRLSTYVLAGLFLSLVSYGFISTLDIAKLSSVFRVITGLTIVLLGLQILFTAHRLLQPIEKIGARLWAKVSSVLKANPVWKRNSYLTGVAWGFLPCGLVYSVLFVATFTGEALSGGLIMLGFGLGTIPSLIFTGVAYQRLRSVVSAQAFQTAGGLFFILGGVLVLTAPYWVSKDFMREYPELVNLVFCVS